MADARHRFVPTSPRTRRRSPGVVSIAALVLTGMFLWPLLHAPSAKPASLRFDARRPALNHLKSLLLSENTVNSVGPDNVREYWLFDGEWTSPRHPGLSLSRAEMLRAVGMDADRYTDYLSLLKAAGAYRAVRQGRRITVHLLPSPGRPPTRLVFDPSRSAAASLGDGWFLDAEAPH